jgi:hypothetical protein
MSYRSRNRLLVTRAVHVIEYYTRVVVVVYTVNVFSFIFIFLFVS